ncbi:response regulator transcription factor [Adlercreutzia aquisgranensis]|uniref:response regulator transcription factor n=1 Tax=Adlercreutzia aquisgranensis TaxID=2941323 RepID=UPI00203A7A82|nr:response regulator transcription factor [Adlercreutzia aquisgranensis]
MMEENVSAKECDRAPLALVADDDASSGSAIEKMLAKDGYRCVQAANGQEALRLFGAMRPDVVILDVMMPLMDGFQVCGRIRERDCETPVLFLSAKGDIVDKRIGYGIGADDYLVKPFSGDELRLRVGALLRRARLARGEGARGGTAPETYRVGDLEVNVHTGDVTVGGRRVELTPKKMRIMAVLAAHPGEVFSKRDLIREIWGEEYLDSSIAISVYVRRIRAKIEPDPSEPTYLRTVWRYGYRLVDRLEG